MRNRAWIAGLFVLALIAAGCGKSGDNNTAQKSPADGAGQTATAPQGPAATVTEFLESIRTGNDEKAMSLLTPTARQKAIETNRSPTPSASDTARYEVGEVRYVNDDGAQVDCAWTDLDEFGKPRTDRALWVCRREAEGWRVAGVAAVVFKGEPPLLLNFEDPADMAKKQEWLRDEMARRTKQENSAADQNAIQAQKPAQDAFRR